MKHLILAVAITVLAALICFLIAAALAHTCPDGVNPNPNGLINLCQISSPTA